MKQKILVAIMVVSLLFNGNIVMAVESDEQEIIIEFSGDGLGTKESPYLISNITQLEEINNDLAAHYKLIEDIDMSKIEIWNPIGSETERFTGEFDGNGHTISNMTINTWTGNGHVSSYIGLFSSLYNCKIKNLNIESVDIEVLNNHVGSLAGAAENSEIKNCSSDGIVYGVGDAGSYIGGIVGTNTNGTISGCRFRGRVDGENYAGGITSTNTGTIINCSTHGRGDNEYIAAYYPGGIVGSNSGTISCCYNENEIWGNHYYGGCGAGGIVGNNTNGKIEFCYNTGYVHFATVESGYVGGICGQGGNVADCYNSGKIRSGDAIVCGIAYTASITRCYNMGSLDGGDERDSSDYIYEYGISYDGNVEDSFYINNVSENGTGFIKTKEELLNRNTYTNYDFDNVWYINNKTYPELNYRKILQDMGMTYYSQMLQDSKNTITVCAYSMEDLFAYIEGANVIIDEFGSAITNADGIATVENTLTDEIKKTEKVSVTKRGYREYYFYKDIYHKDADLLWNSNYESIALRKLQKGDDINPYISTIMCQTSYGTTYNALVSERTYEKSANKQQNAKFRICAIWHNKTPQSYELYQKGGKSYVSDDGIFSLNMGTAFESGLDIYAKITASDGTVSEEKTALKISGNPTLDTEDNTIDLLETDSTGSLGDDVALLSGVDFKLDIKKLKVGVSIEQDKIRVSFGADGLNKGKDGSNEVYSNEDWNAWKKCCSADAKDMDLADWKDKINSLDLNCGWGLKGDVKAYGYAEGKKTEKA